MNSIENDDKTESIKVFKKIYVKFKESGVKGKAIDDDVVDEVLYLANGSDKRIIDVYFDILRDPGLDIDCRLIAFYVLCTKFRRNKDHQKFKQLIQECYFLSNEAIYNIQKAYALITCPENKNQFVEAFNMWEHIDEHYKMMPAFIQIYTETVALCFENEIFKIESKPELNILQQAIELIKIAIANRDYAKFYATLGRLQHCNKQYDTAISNINKAIDKEDSDRIDYAIRISEYGLAIAKIEMSMYTEKKVKELHDFKLGVNELKSEITKSKYDNITFLGFFSAIISFLLGNVQVLNSNSTISIHDRYQLLIALPGVIIITFASLNFVTLTKETIKKSILSSFIMLAIGFLLIYISITIKTLL